VSLTLPPALIVLLYLVGTYRATRIVTRDKLPVVAVPREAFIRRWGVYEDAEDRRISINERQTNLLMSSLAYLWECDWCASIWLGAGLGYVTWRWTETAVWILLTLAASGVTGWLANLEVFLDKKTERMK
jgi:hypothetical protein